MKESFGPIGIWYYFGCFDRYTIRSRARPPLHAIEMDRIGLYYILSREERIIMHVCLVSLRSSPKQLAMNFAYEEGAVFVRDERNRIIYI